jgi:hypothetical protein
MNDSIKDFRKAVEARKAEIIQATLSKSIEQIAQAEAKAALKGLGINGRTRHSRNRLPAPREGNAFSLAPKNLVSSGAILVRGKTPPEKATKPGTAQRRVATLAWNSLHENGEFTSGRATRSDLSKYLVSSLKGEVLDRSVSPCLSILISAGVLKSL